MTKTFAFDPKAATLTAFADRRDAASEGNGAYLFSSIDDIISTPAGMSLSTMADAYNIGAALLEQKPVNKFADRKSGAARLFAIADSLPVQPKKERTVTDTETAPAAGAAGTTAEAAKGRPAGKTGKFVGKTIVGTKEVLEKNPRREGTKGFESMEIIRKAGTAGISHEAYIKAGGRPQNLNRAEAKKWVTFK